MQNILIASDLNLEDLCRTLHLCVIAREITVELLYNEEKINELLKLRKAYVIGKRFRKGSMYDPYNADIEQTAARNEYLDKIPIGEFFLILDSDEIIGGSLNILPQLMKSMVENNVYVAYFDEVTPDSKFKPRPRLLRKKAGMQYYWKHDMIIVPDEVPDHLLREPWRLWEDMELNNCYNYIAPNKKRKLLVPYIKILHNRDLDNVVIS